MKAVRDARQECETQIVAFTLAGETYGIDIAAVQEIIRLQEITPVPCAAGDIEGIINLRGRIVPIVNLRTRLGLPAAERASATRVIVVEVGEETVGLIVDGVSGVVRLPEADIETPSELICAADKVHEEQVRGVGRAGETLIILLNIANVLQRDTA